MQGILWKSENKSLQWPSYSPDLHIMENIWGYLSKDVYSKGPIKNLKTLEFYLKVTISNFNETQSINLYNSMMTRLIILEKHGQRLKYWSNSKMYKSIKWLDNYEIVLSCINRVRSKKIEHVCFLRYFKNCWADLHEFYIYDSPNCIMLLY